MNRFDHGCHVDSRSSVVHLNPRISALPSIARRKDPQQNQDPLLTSTDPQQNRAPLLISSTSYNVDAGSKWIGGVENRFKELYVPRGSANNEGTLQLLNNSTDLSPTSNQPTCIRPPSFSNCIKTRQSQILKILPTLLKLKLLRLWMLKTKPNALTLEFNSSQALKKR